MLLAVLKRFAFVIFIFVAVFNAKAQQTHFVYLQTENGQPFYIKINNKVVSSSPSGYIILPKLADGNYTVSVGFPKKEFPEENFQMLIDKKNQGFLLKNFGEKGWGLFNMQSYGVAMGGNTDTIASPSRKLQDDQFSRMLANVVKDSSILQKNELPKEPAPTIVKVDSPAIKMDSAVAKNNAPAATVDSNIVKPVAVASKADSTVAKADSTATAIEKTLPVLFSPAIRILSKKNKDGREMVYVDHGRDLNDTVRIFIPITKPVIRPNTIDSEVIQNENHVTATTDTVLRADEKQVPQTKQDTALAVATPNNAGVENNEARDSIVVKKAEEKKPPRIIPRDSAVGQPSMTANPKKGDGDIVVLPKVVKSSANNSDCKAFAANEDFLRLRKRMASENTDDNMIKIARKVFHAKCFSTEQIKNLSFLFLTNEGKYRFYDVAYPFAADSDQYYTLQSQLTDSYYLNRFKAMIHK